MGVIQCRRGPRFLLEPREAFGIRGELARQHLDRHLAAQAGVLAEVDLAHAASTELLDDLVGAEGGADHWEPWTGTSRFNSSNQFVIICR